MSASIEAGAPPRLAPVPTLGAPGWVLAAVMALSLGVVFFRALSLMVQWWAGSEEYSYGWLIPPIAVFLVWQKRDALRQLTFGGSWAAVALVALGLGVWLLGELSAIYTLIQYAFVVTLVGAVWSVTGSRALRVIGVAFVVLILMIPLPSFIYFNLSQQLQLRSSEIGVAFIRLCGISVYLEGNVIDLGNYQLQVAEACSGLRYLFPLVTLGFLMALFFRAPLWQRALLVVSTAVITVLMNSFRIGVIGVLVNEYGPAQAQGFLHFFEGWVIFMGCLALLLLEMWLLLRLSGSRRSLRDALALELPAAAPAGQPRVSRPIPASAWAAAALLLAAMVPALTLPERVEAVPARKDFVDFPLQFAGWSGRRAPLESEYIQTLKLTDYLLADYERPGGGAVNLYVAYYASQRKGESVHSPRGCLPGGGWLIEQLGQRSVPGVAVGGQPLRVNRALISHGSDREVVYYWFQQRGRVLTNEYLVKWFLFWDSLTRDRTDGSLVRLIAAVPPGGEAAHADAVLDEFVRAAQPQLAPYLPD